MNGKELKIILPLAVVIILVLSIVGIAIMSAPREDDKPGKVETGPYAMSVGPILDENGEPMEGVIITIQDANGTIGSELTDKDGIANFSFDDKLEPGKYDMVISKPDYVDNNVEVDLDYSDEDIVLSGEDINDSYELIPEKLPPLEFTVGPIRDIDGLLSGVAVELKLNDESLSIIHTNENGTATFTFDTPPEDGYYILNVSYVNYTSIEREIIVDFDNQTHTLSVIGNFDGITLELIPPPEPLPPLELEVGPVSGLEGVLKGVTVELIFNNNTISMMNTDENGYAKFTFDTPPKDGDYVIQITSKDYEVMDIEITLRYDEENHTLIITGDITDVTLVPIIPPEPEDDPDYYKDLDAYKELEGTDKEPVDVEEKLDADHDGTPEYYDDIEDNIDEDVDVEQHVAVDSNGDPEYSPELTGFEGMDPDPYLARRSGQSRSGSEGSSGRGDYQEPANLTHYDDIVDMNNLLDNGTTDIMQYETDVTNPTSANEFTSEVGEVATIIANSLKIGFINGSNATDENNDGNPEHLVIWKVVYILKDRNNDNKIDQKIIAAQIFDLYDNNSNGVFEYSKGFMGALNASDNDFNGQFEEKIYAVAAGVEAIIDGNITNHFKRVGIFYNHTIDKNNDSIFELHRAAIYVQLYFDNNSNGNYELQHEFAGGIEAIDNNSNGKPESLLMVWAGKIVLDKYDNGVESMNRTIMWILSTKDKNEDTKPENTWLLYNLHVSYDNNSNGNPELIRDVIAGYRAVDNNSNGKHERRDAVRAVKHTWDFNDDGVADANVSRGHVFLWRDSNQDNKPEYQLALFYLEQNYDNNSNGNFEFKHNLIRGFLLNDQNSDGKINELRAVHYGILTIDTNDNGKINYGQGFGYAIHLKDKDGDGNLEYKRAVFGFENRWDNNTDGKFEAINQMASGYEAFDNDDDGQLDVERFFILINTTVDKNNDGNPEYRQFTIMASLKVYNSTGTIIFGRNVVHSTVAYDNNSNGNFELVHSILLGHVGYNGTQNGSKVDWESEKILLFFTEMKDNDDNGTWDSDIGVVVKIP